MNTYPSTNITRAKVLALVAAGSLTLSACVGPHPSKVSILAPHRAAASSLQRPKHSAERAIAAWNHVDLGFVDIAPAGSVYVRTWARESMAYGKDMVFDEWAVPRRSPRLSR